MLLAAGWMQSEWAVDSLLTLLVQCVTAGCVYLVFAGLIVIRKRERSLLLNKITYWKSQRSARRLANVASQ